MDRREAAGLVAVMLLIGSTAEGQGPARGPRPAPDPSSQGPVGITPLRSLDTLNGIPSMPGTTPASAASPIGPAPVNPTASGTPAVVPEPPVGRTPVGLSTLPSIRDSINTNDPNAVMPRDGISSFFRKNRGRAAAPTGRSLPAVPADLFAPAPVGPGSAPPPSRLDPSAVPSSYPADADAEAGPATESKVPPGRPSPYANQVPSGARPQADRPSADPTDDAPAGRPAPLSGDRPASPRPRIASDARGPRPTAAANVAPRPLGPRPRIAGPTPAEADPGPPVVVPPPPPRIAPDPAVSALPDGMPRIEPDAPAPPAEPAALPSPAPPVADAEVKPASVDSTAVRLDRPEIARDLPIATRRAAAVGDEVITLHDVEVMVSERYKEIAGGQEVPADQKPRLLNQLAADVLNQLIDQSIVIQEAKRAMKNPKALEQFNDFVDKRWHDDELPPLLRSSGTANEYELKKKLAESGKSYAEMKETFRRAMLANDFLMARIKPKVNADLVEQRAFYNEHLKDYDQPARMTWREIEINHGANSAGKPKYADRAAALRQAQAVHARLARGDDFDAVARAISDGPTASKGGLYVDMTPGGYGIPAVNEELNRLPTGQVSGIIEAPTAFHIVRIDSRREAGPLRFDEVQDKIREEVFRRNYVRARTEYLAKLRAKTLIRTMFDNTDSDPGRARIAADPALRAASTR